MIMRVRYRLLGQHYHCRVYTSRTENITFAKVGDLVFRPDEFEDAKRCMSGAHFIEDTPAIQSPYEPHVSFDDFAPKD